MQSVIEIAPEDREQKDIYVDQVWQILEESYKSIGMLKKKDDLYSNNSSWMISVRDDKVSAVVIYKNINNGRKISLCGANKTSSFGKADLYKLIRSGIDLKDKNSFIEASGAIEHLMLKWGYIPIPNYLSEIILINLGKHISEKASDGVHYVREIGGKECTKCMFGNPPENLMQSSATKTESLFITSKELLENWVDPDTGEEYHDYGTGEIKNPPHDIFDTTMTGMSDKDELIPGNRENDFWLNSRNKIGNIVYMTPREYYQRCSGGNGIFNSSEEDLFASRERDTGKLDTIETVIKKFHRQLPMTFIDYTTGGQEGLHRMLVLGKMYGWTVKYPVLVIDWADKERHKRDEEESNRNDIERRIENAVENTLSFSFKSVDEFFEELGYQLITAFEYRDEFDGADEIPYKLDETDTTYTVSVLDVPYEFDKDRIQIKENSENDEESGIDDDIDYDDIDFDIEKYFLR